MKCKYLVLKGVVGQCTCRWRQCLYRAGNTRNRTVSLWALLNTWVTFRSFQRRGNFKNTFSCWIYVIQLFTSFKVLFGKLVWKQSFCFHFVQIVIQKWQISALKTKLIQCLSVFTFLKPFSAPIIYDSLVRIIPKKKILVFVHFHHNIISFYCYFSHCFRLIAFWNLLKG